MLALAPAAGGNPERGHAMFSHDLLPKAVRSVVETERCTGCGFCVHLDDRIRMHEKDGFLRPTMSDPAADVRDTRTAARLFRRVCPGVSVSASAPEGAKRHRTLGPLRTLAIGWATDPDVRFAGSSGGVLSALLGWLVESRQVTTATASQPDPVNPRRTIPLSVVNRQDVLRSAGSRYEPATVGPAAPVDDPGAVVVCKPCEAQALRSYSTSVGSQAPLILSFFCAGTPSHQATDSLLAKLGVQSHEQLDSLRYRGNGWPGHFTAKTRSGRVVAETYEKS
ncbi:MAG: coenzyme F420 hydrogenase/dehydrogenase beta subunit N-terminal domain-containing protein, partial [Propioniciclava sp.]